MSATARPWAMWGLGVLAYAVAVFQRGSLSVSGLAFQHRFHAGSADLALLAVLQLLVYASLQIPVGLALDRVGPRVLIATGAVLMAGGQVIMAVSTHVVTAVLARVLVGSGDAMTFISALRVLAAWFPPTRVPLMTQMTAILGQLGQVAAAFPLVALLDGEGWTTSFVVAAAASLTVSIAVFSGLREVPGKPWVSAPVAAGFSVRDGLTAAWNEPGTRIGLWTHFVNQFSGNTFALLWGYPFLVDGEKVSSAVAGGLISLQVLLGMGVGPALGSLSGQWPLRRSALTIVIVTASMAAWTAVLAWPGRTPLVLLVLLVVTLSTNSPGSMIGFDYARTFNPPERMGSASGIVNVGGFAASLVVILLIGAALAGLGHDTPSTYTSGAFRLAFLVQYPFWALGLWQVHRVRRVLRRRLHEEGVVIDPLHLALRRRLGMQRDAEV